MAALDRSAVRDAIVATLVLGLWIALLAQLTTALPWLGGSSGALVALAFLAWPLLDARRGFVGDLHGFGPGSLPRALLIGVMVVALLLPLFVAGYDVVARSLWGQRRLPLSALLATDASLQGGAPSVPGAIGIGESRSALQLRNGLDRAVAIVPACRGAGCEPSILKPGGQGLLPHPAADRFDLRELDGRALDASLVRVGAAASAPDLGPDGGRFGSSRSLLWMIWYLLDQILVVALPEEALFRGWMLARLRRRWPPQRRVFGVPFGAAHVLCAVLFALVHLAAIPAPHRLLVVFPGLLFAWVAERAQHTGAAVVVHAGSNAMLLFVSRIYG